MKKFAFVMVTAFFFATAFSAQAANRKPSALSCAKAIQDAALKVAKGDGLDNCHVGTPKLSSSGGSEGLRRMGSIGMMCQKHMSEASAVSVPESYTFSLIPGDCSTVAVYDNEAHPGE